MMPHIPAVLTIFGVIETIRVSGVRVGQYVGVDGVRRRRTLINKETFAHVRFTLHAMAPDQTFMSGDAYIGKGIRGSKALGIEGDVKLLELNGINDNKFQFDLRSSGLGFGKAYLIKKDGSKTAVCNLTDDPYHLIISDAVRRLADPSHTSQLTLPVEKAKSILAGLEDMRWPFRDFGKRKFATYPLGAGGDDAPYLEDVLQRLEPVQPFMYPVGAS